MVQTAVEEGAELPLFLIEVAHPPTGTRTVPESDPIIRGQTDQERAAPGVAENYQNAGSRDTTSVGQAGTPRTRSEATSTTPGEAVPIPSNGGLGRVARKG